MTNPPYIRTSHTVTYLMTMVIISSLPILLTAYLLKGNIFLMQTAVCIGSSAAAELIARGIFARDISLHDVSAFVTGMILSLLLPDNTPLWIAAVSSAAAVLAGKQMFGGLGKNIFNPALVGLLCASGIILFLHSFKALQGSIHQNISSYWVNGRLLSDHFTSACSTTVFSVGSLSGIEFLVPALCMLCILLCTGVIRWELPLFGTIGAVSAAALSSALHLTVHPLALSFFLASGGCIFLVSAVLTDPVTSPLTAAGRIIYACIAGIFLSTVFLLTKSSYCAALSILAANAFSPALNRLLVRTR